MLFSTWAVRRLERRQGAGVAGQQAFGLASPDDQFGDPAEHALAGEGFLAKVCWKPPDVAAGWLKDRLVNLSVMVPGNAGDQPHVLDTDTLAAADPGPWSLNWGSGADRGAILLKDENGKLIPKAVRWQGAADPDERLTISRTIVDHVLTEGQGVITSDASGDKRFGPAQSIVDYNIREAICVPVQGRHVTLGVIYADIQSGSGVSFNNDGTVAPTSRGKFSQDHLMLMVAIGHQAGLAIENTEFVQGRGRSRPSGSRRSDRQSPRCRIIYQEHPARHPRRQLPDRHGAKGDRRGDRPARLDDRREEPGEDL